MQRIRQRKYGRTGDSPHALSATHCIKIGFDARQANDKHPKPGKLRGFLICRDTVDHSNQLVVDMECMAKFKVTPAMVKEAKDGQFRAKDGLLPTELKFVLTQDAARVGEQWIYPGTFYEEYESWGKLGLFCHGDGVEASRRQDDGTRKCIACVPKGKADTAAEAWCPISVKGDCKAKSRLVLCLFSEGKDGRPVPLSDALGWQARYRLDTSSEYNPMRFLQALDAASDRLHGRIAGIPGNLTFAVQRKRTGLVDSPVGVVGQVMLTLSEQEISKREREQWERQIEERRVYALPEAPKMIGKGDEDSPEIERDEEEPIIIGDDSWAVGDGRPFAEDLDPVGSDVDEGPDEGADDGETGRPAQAANLRERAVRGRDMLLTDFPRATDTLGFELHSRWGVKTVEEVPDANLTDLLALLLELYRDERGESQKE